MESNSGREIVGFAFLRRRLLELVNYRIGSGEFTERGFARLIGISQPQVHNILKGARNLSPETADLMLEKLAISALDLLTPSERSSATSFCDVVTVISARSALRKPAALDTARRGKLAS